MCRVFRRRVSEPQGSQLSPFCSPSLPSQVCLPSFNALPRTQKVKSSQVSCFFYPLFYFPGDFHGFCKCVRLLGWKSGNWFKKKKKSLPVNEEWLRDTWLAGRGDCYLCRSGDHQTWTAHVFDLPDLHRIFIAHKEKPASYSWDRETSWHWSLGGKSLKVFSREEPGSNSFVASNCSSVAVEGRAQRGFIRDQSIVDAVRAFWTTLLSKDKTQDCGGNGRKRLLKLSRLDSREFKLAVFGKCLCTIQSYFYFFNFCIF